jgi:hypothetical protein
MRKPDPLPDPGAPTKKRASTSTATSLMQRASYSDDDEPAPATHIPVRPTDAASALFLSARTSTISTSPPSNSSSSTTTVVKRKRSRPHVARDDGLEDDSDGVQADVEVGSGCVNMDGRRRSVAPGVGSGAWADREKGREGGDHRRRTMIV